MTGDRPAFGVDAVVVAAGASRRMGGLDKLAVRVGGRQLLGLTVEAVRRSPLVERVVVVVAADRVDDVARDLGDLATMVVAGGQRRHESVAAGLDALVRIDAEIGSEAFTAGRERVVLVHDGARPLVTRGLVEAVALAAEREGAAIPVLPVSDTIKSVEGTRVSGTVDRTGLMAAQTPQGMRRGLLLDAFARFPPDGPLEWTDEAALLEACGIAVHVVPGGAENLKVTVPEDLAVVARAIGSTGVRIGIGRDSHPFGPGEPLILAGIEIAGAPRLYGHSDGDVALHAVADALLGAAGLPDLGRHFPADASTPVGVDSGSLLASAIAAVAGAGWMPAAVDVTIVGSRPRLTAYLDRMRGSLADRLGIDPSAVSVKASSGNLSGDEGAGRAMSALAIATARQA
ncbi:MAG TPA: 2-C-methyl-D-erythritol 2,4-cyclodiphosphate synthase [Candidatus Limnocylindrales bacterium]|nr:2-C-methyl-D-erythritol 2,4-cyclodiphosphate synthase [Candidatus Limnocylindrales bacterium]